VYMLTPRPESNDARIVRVSSENLATCTTLWKESEVFNFGALFRAFRMNHNSIPNQGIILMLCKAREQNLASMVAGMIKEVVSWL